MWECKLYIIINYEIYEEREQTEIYSEKNIICVHYLSVAK